MSSAEFRQKREIELVSDVCRTYSGRAFIHMLMEGSGLEQGIFDENPLHMARKEGRREAGMWARDWVLTVAPECLNIMRREAEERDLQYEIQARDQETELNGRE